MNDFSFLFIAPLRSIVGVSLFLVQVGMIDAITTPLFDSSQAIALTNSATTSDTYRTERYLFTVTRDKLFTGGGSQTIGRNVSVPWPAGIEAQAVTAGPNPSKATVTIRRVEGQLFAMPSFTVKLLASTGGAGAALEIMPLLNGEDGLPDPLMFNVTGYANQSFPFTSTQLTGFDTYKVTLYVDFAFTSMTLVDASLSSPPPPPQLRLVHLGGTSFQLSWPVSSYSYWFDSSTDLTPEGWVQGNETIQVTGGFNLVNLQLAGPRAFFRLCN